MKYFIIISCIFLHIFFNGLLGAENVRDKIKQQEITIAYSEYPPYEFGIMGGEDGLTIRKIKAVGKELDLNLRFIFMPWARALYMAKSGEINAILSLNATKERESFLSFPRVPLAKNEEAVFSLASRKLPLIDSYDDFAGITIGVIEDYTYGKQFDALTNIRKVYARDDISLIERLRRGWLDHIVISRKVFYYQIKKLNLKASDFIMHPLILNTQSLSLGVSKKYPYYSELTKLFEEALVHYPKDYDNEILINEHCTYGTKGCGRP